MSRWARGKRNHAAGEAAEDAAAAWYAARGGRALARRWRAPADHDGPGGEIDLVVADGDALVFVEVKAGRNAAAAFARITPRVWARLEAAAARYMVAHPTGAAVVRFDAVHVDPFGAVTVAQNARESEAW